MKDEAKLDLRDLYEWCGKEDVCKALEMELDADIYVLAVILSGGFTGALKLPLSGCLWILPWKR